MKYECKLGVGFIELGLMLKSLDFELIRSNQILSAANNDCILCPITILVRSWNKLSR